MNYIELHIDKKTYRTKNKTQTVLENLDLTVHKADTLAIIGESGAGKTTLLNILGLIDNKYQGTYTLNNTNTRTLTDTQKAEWRNQNIGFVLQESALINTYTIKENIQLPLHYANKQHQPAKQRIEKLAEQLDIQQILDKKPIHCSGGEKARTAFARAILMQPQLILADEPTSNLDSQNATKITELLFKMREKHGTTIVTVTHDPAVAAQHDKTIKLEKTPQNS